MALAQSRHAGMLGAMGCNVPTRLVPVQVWDGTWSLLRLLQQPVAQHIKGLKVLELGSGTGLAGLFAAHLGASILLTDVASNVQLLQSNIQANAAQAHCGHNPALPIPATRSEQGAGCRPDDAADMLAAVLQKADTSAQDDGRIAGAKGLVIPAQNPRAQTRTSPCTAVAETADGERGMRTNWTGAMSIGHGSAAAASLDWTETIDSQLRDSGNDPRDAEAVMACEVLWLAELVDPFVSTLAQVMAGPHRPTCFMTYTDRGTPQSQTFAHCGMVLQAFQAHGLQVEEVESLQSTTADGEPVYAWIVTLAVLRRAFDTFSLSL